MDELINRNDAMREVERVFVRLYLEALRTDTEAAGVVKVHRDAARKALLNVETADAQYNKYGTWILLGHTLAGSPIWQCSCCGRARKGAGRSTYCRDCGAKLEVI